jgi:hypothetical protein
MNPIEIIDRAAEDGVLLTLLPSGTISARGEPPVIDRWIPAVRANKAAIVALLRAGEDEWRAFFDKWVTLAESKGGLPRAKAEDRAFTCCVVEWSNHHFVGSPPGRCSACGEPDLGGDPLLPFGFGTTGPAWLHGRCWPAWRSNRQAEAAAALAVLGIKDRRNNR